MKEVASMTRIKSKTSAEGLSASQVEQFMRDGYVIARHLATDSLCQRMVQSIEASLQPALGPLEYETDVMYPGAPSSHSAAGGLTPRRLLNAYTRDAVYRQWASSKPVLSAVRKLISADSLLLTQNHHNCIMTKMPRFSSQTGWHQDIRYWSFDRPELVNVWLALGDEFVDKGGMKFIPGSHRLELDRGRFDAELFLREDLEENKPLIDSAVDIELTAGDVIFFHCRTFHVAGKNNTAEAKYSVVFSYHAADNLPIPDTRSARLEGIKMI